MNAPHVLVWLGPDHQGVAGSALKLLQELDEMFQDETKSQEFHMDHTKDLEKQSRSRWDALDHLTDVPWVFQPFPFSFMASPSPFLNVASL